MRALRRAAAWAACLLALAAVAAAQANCTQSYMKLDLMAPIGIDDPVAKCLTSFRIDLSSNCTVTITPLTTGGTYLDAIWSGSNDKMALRRYTECPRGAGYPVQASLVARDQLEAIRYAIIRAMSGYPYGFDAWGNYNKEMEIPDLDYQPGIMLVKRLKSFNLVYAVTEFNMTTADMLQDTGVPLTTISDCSQLYHPDPVYNAEPYCRNNSIIWQPCPSNSYGIIIGDSQATAFKLCGLCPAGTSGEGYGCTTCTAGQYSRIGQACTNCTAGYYSQAGSSNCLPCPLGTYTSLNGSRSCTECPEDTMAWLPGADACLRCVRGVPERCVDGNCPSGPVVANQPASSPGTMIASVTRMPTCGLIASTGYELKAYTKCTSWKTQTTPVLQLAFEVAGDCSIQISPITDPSCADPTDPRTSPGSPTYDATVHPYGAIQMRGYYHWDTASSSFRIRSLFDTGNGVIKSVMLAVDPVSGSGTALNMTFFAATTDAQTSNSPIIDDKPDSDPIVCSATLNVEGGKIVGLNDTDANCPTGSYLDMSTAAAFCPICPVGYTCTSNALTPCPPNTFNSLLGFGGTCAACPDGGNYTTYAAAQQCDVAKLDLLCTSDQSYSFQFDSATQDCIKCPAGTWRDYVNGTTNLCTPCPPGTFSASGDRRCMSCPIGEYNSLEGLADQSDLTGYDCVLCAEGSMPLKSGVAGVDAVPETGSTYCDACPAGTYLPNYNRACVACPEGTYRTGDATPENNKCKPIPPGYKLKDDTHTEIELCPPGQVSFYDQAGQRVPRNDSLSCLACADVDAVLGLTGASLAWAHTYAPRKGMDACVPCPGGTRPFTNTTDGVKTTASCVPCPHGYYRDAYAVSVDCVLCGPGREVAPSSKMACTMCRAGTYMDATRAASNTTAANNCAPCAKNTYRATMGATSCVPCPRGTETSNEGNVECTACALGYYNNVPGGPCLAAPLGTFVNVTGAFLPSTCPVGTFNDDTAQDGCEPCAPGKFSNILGTRECRTCAAGTFSKSGATRCIDCKPGSFAPAGASSCALCPLATYAPTAKSAKCKMCPRGFQCPSRGMRVEGACPRGTFSNKEGNRLCTPCPVNTVSVGGAPATAGGDPVPVVACTKCAAGTSTRGLTGQSRCQAIRPAVRRLLSSGN